MAVAISLHLLSAIIWVGGMFFAYMALRPAAARVLEPPHRLSLWGATFQGFFRWVWMAVALLVGTGYWMIFAVFGGMGGVGWHIHVMQLLGWVMIALFVYLYFGPYFALRRAVAEEAWPKAGAQLNIIRRVVAVNLCLGLLLVVIAGGGRYVAWS